MCTLTYFPTTTGYIFTHNRDENVLREKAEPPQWREYKGLQIAFPKDGQAGGTWIACRENISVCLLNGAFVKHRHQPPYRMSRGIVLLDIFTFASLSEFSKAYNLQGIEPFSVVMANGQNTVEELRWDGSVVHFSDLPFAPAIWSSATLYDMEAQQKRRELFEIFIERNRDPDATDIFEFHHSGKVGNSKEDLVMERPNGVKTLSISQIVCASDQCHFRYDDMYHHRSYQI